MMTTNEMVIVVLVTRIVGDMMRHGLPVILYTMNHTTINHHMSHVVCMYVCMYHVDC